MEVNSLNHFKSVFAHHFFVQPADRNYLLARWCRIHGWHQEFFWQAQQAIEKYVKACLVLNGTSVKGKGHNIEHLFLLLPSALGSSSQVRFEQPAELNQYLWRSRTPEQFISRINKTRSTRHPIWIIVLARRYF